MTAAADANLRTPHHPLGRVGLAEPHTALQHGGPPPTPAAPPFGPTAAPVIPTAIAPLPFPYTTSLEDRTLGVHSAGVHSAGAHRAGANRADTHGAEHRGLEDRRAEDRRAENHRSDSHPLGTNASEHMAVDRIDDHHEPYLLGAHGEATRGPLTHQQRHSARSGAAAGAGATSSGVHPHTEAASSWHLPVRALGRGEQLYRAGMPAEALFIIEAGLVALELDVPKARIVALAGPGDAIGSLAPGKGSYLETATTLSGEVVLRRLDSAAHSLLPPAESAALLLAAARARVSALTHALEESEQPVPARIARAFLRLGSRFGHELQDGTVRLTLPITHDTLAAMVGAARETTTAVIAQLRQAGLVQGTRGNYRIAPAPLAAYALEVALAS